MRRGGRGFLACSRGGGFCLESSGVWVFLVSFVFSDFFNSFRVCFVRYFDLVNGKFSKFVNSFDGKKLFRTFC